MDSVAVDMRDITKVFDHKAANDHVNFTLRRGTIHGLLGENGAGKTTLMNILYGLYKPESGDIFLKGERVDIHSPEKAISLGIGMVHQHFMLANPLTVTENIMAGNFRKRQVLLRKDQFRREILELAERYKMKVDPDSYIWQNSVGEQQRIEILSVLFQDIDILILDEPTAVLTPSETDELFLTLRELVDDGKSIVMITHKLDEILKVADEVTVLRDGKNVGSSKIDDTVTKHDLSSWMIGYDIELDLSSSRKPTGDHVALSVTDLTIKNDKDLTAVDHISFDIKQGEILGLAGVDGNGQKELCEALTGLRPIESGDVYKRQVYDMRFVSCLLNHVDKFDFEINARADVCYVTVDDGTDSTPSRNKSRLLQDGQAVSQLRAADAQFSGKFSLRRQFVRIFIATETHVI